jgi:F-type H+-transporting ATPase subunit b
MTLKSGRPALLLSRCYPCLLALAVLVSVGVFAQEPGNLPETTAPSTSSSEPQKKSPGQQAGHEEPVRRNPGFGAELAKQTREAAGEDEDAAQFKQSASVKFLARITGLDLQHAYWLAVVLNFAVIAGVLFWAGRKFLPGAFRARTAAIQHAMEEARRASEDANRRLSEIESRLSKLGDEISAMKTAGEADLAAEEARIKAAAEQDARKIVELAEQEISAAAKTARRDLTTYAADLAISLAKKQIHVDAGTDSSLLRSFADRLSSAEDGGKN